MRTTGGNRPAFSVLSRPARLIRVLLPLILLPACGAPFVVGDARFDLRGPDAAVARELDLHDRSLATPGERCHFWRDDAPRLAVARSPHAAGDAPPTLLLAYARARADSRCAPLDRAGVEAQAERQRAHERACAARYPEALAAAESARRASDAERANQQLSARSDSALRQWVGGHVGMRKLPCAPSGSDYVAGLQVTNRAQSVLACALAEVFAQSASSTAPAGKQVIVEPGKSATLEVPVRACAAAPGVRKLVLTCRLSEENRAEAGIDDARLRWFGYDVDSLEFTTELSGKVEGSASARSEPALDRAKFMADCLSAAGE